MAKKITNNDNLKKIVQTYFQVDLSIFIKSMHLKNHNNKLTSNQSYTYLYIYGGKGKITGSIYIDFLVG